MMKRPTGVPSHIKFTNAAVAALPMATSGQYLVRDETLKNFFLVIGKAARTYTVQVDSRRLGTNRTTRQAIGRSTNWGATAARAEAKLRIGGLQTGVVAPRATAVTLAAAWASYRDLLGEQVANGDRSRNTIRAYANCIENVLADWASVSLRKLSDDAQGVKARHREITRAGKPALANLTMRTLRACYVHAKKTRLERDLPAELPTDAVVWNREERKSKGMAQGQLAAWYKQLRAMGSPVREEFHLMLLLSGSRPNAMRRAKWEHLDVARRNLHFPAANMKGGKPFDMPLSGAMIDCLDCAREVGKMIHPRTAETYIFPGKAGDGHLGDTEEPRERLAAHGGALRQTYRTACVGAEVSEIYCRILMAHALSKDVSEGYITKGALGGHLLEAQERVSAYLVEGLHGCAT